ncbi:MULTISPECIES: S4 domain-containing protein YaaA [Exiguobacterium]|jgi:S4 domain protein YaaA|uniref:S4 domain protein YaaA n=4 Tax=Exiguobacterium TaxID=33986 RepID=C4KZZ1_EXISA|nr:MULTISPECIES: S4 domain-containing protein YaaA [Exiguobacterium]MCC9625415.1 S4 domain-containing protein YaaA [Thalassospira sp. MA62]QPI67735.1 S4 domain-containing protein YaaA [Exiguobacterium sp. PBE]ACQ70654.1 S4 domain protein YaaA [Exiguobacterium sp. AT1b]MBG0918688.1 S4 domain-containing protein YaaA [Exiguobacterium sp. SRB7LM]MBQ6458264.1 S4 domain-containing protein YaaA [Exiguobacterium sp.]
MEKVSITTEYVTLGQFLKLADIISSGGQAKFFLEDVMIKVNGEQDQRRGRKLRDGDTIEVEGFGEYQIEGN